MIRDELIAKLLTFDNVEVKVWADYVTYPINEEEVDQSDGIIYIAPDR